MVDVGAYSSVDVVGVPVGRLSLMEIVSTILDWTETSGMKVALGVNAYVCNMAARDPSFRDRVLGADLAYADGQAIVWAARALGAPIDGRSATTDLIYPLVTECVRKNKRVFLFGGVSGVAQLAGERLAEHAPGLFFRSHHGDVSHESTQALLMELAEFNPDVLLIGLGDPLQQNWIVENRTSLQVPAILTCGGLFDWVSGAHKRAPVWMIRSGLEWLWRLILEPRRLASRYMVGNVTFIARFSVQFARSKLYRRAR